MSFIIILHYIGVVVVVIKDNPQNIYFIAIATCASRGNFFSKPKLA